MGSLNIHSKRRKFLDILKYEVDVDEDVDLVLGPYSELLTDNIEVLPDSEMLVESSISEFSCCYCDKQFNSKRDVKSHKKVHTQARPYSCNNLACDKRFKTSSNLRRHERICSKVGSLPSDQKINDIVSAEKPSSDIYKDDNSCEILGTNELFDKILSEETAFPNQKERLAEPFLDDYNDMLENLIASTSPDELVLKSSINNEIPEVLDDIIFSNCKRKLGDTDLELDEEGSSPKKKGEVKEHIFDVSNRLNSVIDNPEQKFSYKDQNEKKTLNFENLVNKKIFNVLNTNVKHFKAYNYQSANVQFTVTLPAAQTPLETSFEKTCSFGSELRHKMLEGSNQERKIDKCRSLVKNKIHNKSSKRGSLGWQLKLEMEELEEIEDEVDKGTESERLKDLEIKLPNCSKHTDKIKQNSTDYNKKVLENIYANASKTKQTLRQGDPKNLFSESNYASTINITESVKSAAENRRKSWESVSQESSQENPAYNMPILDFL